MTEATIAERLRAACRGHPAAHIEWPHRLLHEAADRIEELEEALGAMVDRFPMTEDRLFSQRVALRRATAAIGGTLSPSGEPQPSPEPRT